MKLIVGLGNPGASYERTRHNAGFMAIDRLVERHAKGAVPRARFNAITFDAALAGSASDEKCLLMKPTTYMNRSGLAVGEAVRFYKINPAADLLVIVDEVYLPCGVIRLRESGGSGGHNGLTDIEQALGTDRYPRCRIGVDLPGIMEQADYVLGRFTDEQWALAGPAINKAADAAEEFVRAGLAAAANKFNAKDPPRPKPPRREPDDGPTPLVTPVQKTQDPGPKSKDPQGFQP